MGEVYRADDLRLGQPVALKFLPEELSRDASRLALLHNEVRAARQVSHPNICRVWPTSAAAKGSCICRWSSSTAKTWRRRAALRPVA